jgi:hypothetical protein
MSLMTPSLHAAGLYQLASPWTIPANVIYECIAIRDFDDFVKKGEDVFTLYYQPMGLDRSVYEADRALGADIITLASATHPTIYVPSTYIVAYPFLGDIKYSHVVLSVSLGALPDAMDLTFVKAQVAAVVSDSIGVVPTVNVNVAPSTGLITQIEHQILETARQAAITNRKTDRAKLIEMQTLIDAQAQRIAGLEQIIIDAGLLPP